MLFSPAVPAPQVGMHWRRWCFLAMVLAVAILIPLGWKLRLPGFDVKDYSQITDVRESTNID